MKGMSCNVWGTCKGMFRGLRTSNFAKARVLVLLLAMLLPLRMFGDGWTPTDAGLVVKFQPGDQFLLSVFIDVNGNGVEDAGEEFFVCDYPSGGNSGRFNYAAGNYLKLIPQDANATAPSAVSVWTVDTAVTRNVGANNYALGGISYTMWSNSGNNGYSIWADDGWKMLGNLTTKNSNKTDKLCDVVFVVPTIKAVTNMDPNGTLNASHTANGRNRGTGDKSWAFDGKTGVGFAGMVYREVYWFELPRSNRPIAYTNAAMVGFNTTTGNMTVRGTTINKGKAYWVYKTNYNDVPRMLFRLYNLTQQFGNCPDSYFFAHDEQDYVKYRWGDPETSKAAERGQMTDSTTARKIYTTDHHHCMQRLEDTKYYLSDWLFVPESDSAYYYVGYQNKYCHTDRGDAFDSQFKKIGTLPIQYLGLPAPKGAYGQMIVDTTTAPAQNLNVAFTPGGYFLRTNTGRNIRLKPNADRTVWTCEEMWHITAAYAALTIKATMFTGSEYSDTDPGADIPGWSQMVVGTSVPVVGGGSIIDRDGWARIYINSTEPNGAMEFVPANPDRHIRYDNNGYVGEQLPDQYPLYGETSVTVEEPRLVGGFVFTEWNTAADGSGTTYHPGDVVNLSAGETTLYAIATYTGTIHVAISFLKEDGKRYFLTHPGTAAPRYSRARGVTDWTDTWQGMANADNVDNHYLNTFKIFAHPNPCAKCAPDEVVLGPRREMRYGAEDSLLFYENFHPAEEEYIGLYYTAPNTVLGNNTWAGLFTSTAAGGSNGWPDYSVADVKNAKLRSTHYLGRDNGNITRLERSNSGVSYVKYNAAADQFDGEASEANATVFQISRVRVADEHYVVLPDTTKEWEDEIVFGIHQGGQTQKTVWSALIGKKLMAMTTAGDDVVYFHPDRTRILTTADALRLTPAYRLVETFTYIRDARVESLATVDDGDKPHISTTANDFSRLVTSGMNSPMDVVYQGGYIDIVDTLRITLRTNGPAKIKEYYGRWKDGAEGLHVRADGSRYRDIIIRTKTCHYGANITKLVLTPEYPAYNFAPLSGDSEQLNFSLAKVTSRQLLDTDGNVLGEEVLTSEDVTASLRLAPGFCSFRNGGTHFRVENEQTLNDHITLVTRADNSSEVNHDTLIISMNVTVDAVSYPVTARIPLMQTAMSDEELVWSVVYNGKRYFILAGSGGLIFREYEKKGETLYKKEDGKTQLVKGSADAANSQTQYITPWNYAYVNQAQRQLTLLTEYNVNRYFVINGLSAPDVAESGPATLTYEYVSENINDNANYEEVVKLKYGADKWLRFSVTADVPSLTLTENAEEASEFSWSYLQPEYNLLNNGDWPSVSSLEFGYNRTDGATVQTRYKAYSVYSMLLGNTLTYCGREEEKDIADLVSSGNVWKTDTTITLVRDSRFAPGASGLGRTTDGATLVTTVTPAGDSPIDFRYPAGTGPFVDIVDTLDVVISLQSNAPAYRFKDAWSGFASVDDAHLKIPLIRKTYHQVPYDSLVCTVGGDEHEHVFPSEISTGVNDTYTFTLYTERHYGTHFLDVAGHAAAYTGESEDHTEGMDFTNHDLAEIRLLDEHGNTPDWCEISDTTANTITIRCLGDGIRSPRSASLYLAYMMQVNGVWKFLNHTLGVTQLSRFQYANNQHLLHSKGASGDPLKDGVQQVHENKNILYYYNPSNAAQSTDQRVELPVRERNMYGWWRWYSLQPGEEDTDIPADKWQTPPSNTYEAYKFPFRIIGDSVWVDEEDHSRGKRLLTQGRYTVFHYPSKKAYDRKNPPSKAPMVYPPQNKDTVTYAVDLSVYYDNLPLSMANVNQVDTAVMDTLRQIIEPTLSLREIYELHPWTEMAERMEGYKDTIASSYRNPAYMEDHTVMAPLGNRLLLKTEQRYNYDNVKAGKHSESLLGYYMRDDNWATGGWDAARKDSMIWCGGWDAECKWYTYNTRTKTYSACPHPITTDNDFLNVPARYSLSSGDADTVIYCLRARSVKSTHAGTVGDPDPAEPVAGDYWFNICRYTVIYHRPAKYGPLLEDNGSAIISDEEITQNFEVLERLNFDYNKPGSEYTVYPHPLPWADASYGFAYPMTPALPDNRPHNSDGLENLANMGEYGLINRIPDFGKYWYKMEQHGGAENGYMIFCDGMSSAGQVAALSLKSNLCEGQKMYFSGYVGNPNSEGVSTHGKPNFTFSVQGSADGDDWEDITSYMTGDLEPSDQWYQIFFPIEQERSYEYFRVRVFNMASNNTGNDFVIDDMCIFATKPPLMVYQANTTCKAEQENDSLTHIVLRVDYQGFTEDVYAAGDEYYTIETVTKNDEYSFLKLEDGYYDEHVNHAVLPATADTFYGHIPMPERYYHPQDEDSIFSNLQALISKFERTLDSGGEVFRKGYIYEHLDDSIRPVMYVIHTAKMSSDNTYIIHMAGSYNSLLGSRCALTRTLKVRNRMMLTLNGEEQPEKDVQNMCANTTYEVSLHVKGTLLLDHTAPQEITGACVNDWLLYGDTAEVSSEARYGYKYSDIVKVVKEILRAENEFGTPNENQHARTFSEVSRSEMRRIQTERGVSLSDGSLNPYDVLKNLVDNGFLVLYQPSLTVVTPVNSAISYTIFPIQGTGSQVMQDLNIEVCPTPVQISLESSLGGGVPLIIGGLHRTEEESQYPIVVLADPRQANTELVIPIDSLMLITDTDLPRVAIDTILFLSTNDPEYREGIHTLSLVPDRTWHLSGENTGYYQNGADTLRLVPAPTNNYAMRPGYLYTFGILMMDWTGHISWAGISDNCPVGTVPFTVGVVPDYLRWDPQNPEDNRWNNPDNWIGVVQTNEPIHEGARFAPLPSTYVVIPPMTDGRPYPVLPDPAAIPYSDSIQQVGFQYNTCHSIRFLSGAALSQQQRLEYDSVIADLTAPHNKWAFRSAPVTGLLSGDIFMADADLTHHTPTWEVGAFDANGRSYTTGNGSFWLSLYNKDAIRQSNGTRIDTVKTEAAEWSKVTNALSLSLQPAQGWAVFSRTKSGLDPVVRLPKNDDIYYYYYKSGDKAWDLYEPNLRILRAREAGGADKVGKLAFYPGKEATSQSYILSTGTAATTFVFGNPTMGYIDIWGFISDNTDILEDEIGYMGSDGLYTTVTKESLTEPDAIASQSRYMPPMHAIVVKKKNAAATSLGVTLKTNRIVTDASQIERPLLLPAPLRGRGGDSLRGIMTVTATNSASYRCTSRLLLGQGWHAEIIKGEDAMLTTINIDNYSATSTPTTPFNIYAVEGSAGLSIDLRDEILYVPLSFYMSDLEFDATTRLWFTGVNQIDGPLVFWDALTDTEQPIIDGICIDIETPQENHEMRYYIRRPGYKPDEQTDPQIPTGVLIPAADTKAVKIFRDGHVFILRNGHIYTTTGQKVQ